MKNHLIKVTSGDGVKRFYQVPSEAQSANTLLHYAEDLVGKLEAML